MQKLFKILLVVGIVGNVSASNFEKNQNRQDKKEIYQQRNLARRKKEAHQENFDSPSKLLRVAYLVGITGKNSK